ncbi:PIN domain-containing protein [Treponema sp. R6D11]
MNIVDSSLWVEYFLENDIDQSIIDTIKDTDNLYIPVISLYEVYKKFLSIGDSEKANIAVAIMQNVDIIGISPLWVHDIVWLLDHSRRSGCQVFLLLKKLSHVLQTKTFVV